MSQKENMTQCTRVRRPGDGENKRAALHFLNNGGRAICSEREKEKKEQDGPGRKRQSADNTYIHTSGIRERKTQPELHACEHKKRKKEKKNSKNVRMDHSMRTRLFFITGRVHACVRALSFFCRRRSFGHTDTLGTKQFGVRRVLCRCSVAGCSHSLSVKVAGVEGVGEGDARVVRGK